MKSWGVLWLGLGVALVWPLTSQGITRYVAPGGNHTTPFTNWVTAATNIQAAIDVSSAGDLVWVTNGTYQTGGRTAPGSLTTNRVVIDKAITVRSVNGPVVTMIRGAFQPGGTNGNEAIRCVWMTNNAVLVGFTLTNGATRASDYGGGVWCQSTAAYISNCFILGNAADAEGGGVLFGSLQFCTLAGNAASLGGGASGSQLTLCNVTSNRASVGGGVLLGTLALCQLFGNQATTFGGGVSGGTLTNCTLLGNVSGNQGGGAYAATLNNSLVLQNSAAYGGGVAKGTLHQCNVISNMAAQAGGGAYTSTLNRCRVIGNIATNQGGGACQSTLNNSVLEGISRRIMAAARFPQASSTARSPGMARVNMPVAPTSARWPTALSISTSPEFPGRRMTWGARSPTVAPAWIRAAPATSPRIPGSSSWAREICVSCPPRPA
jgi:hypothetical protein